MTTANSKGIENIMQIAARIINKTKRLKNIVPVIESLEEIIRLPTKPVTLNSAISPSKI
jgi:hypothetical protein